MSFQEPVNATDICALRRDVHRWPEPGWAEFVSSARVIEHLEKAGLKVLCGREVINDAFIRGANRKQIEAGLAAAREKGVSEAILKRLDGVTGVAGILELDAQALQDDYSARFGRGEHGADVGQRLEKRFDLVRLAAFDEFPTTVAVVRSLTRRNDDAVNHQKANKQKVREKAGRRHWTDVAGARARNRTAHGHFPQSEERILYSMRSLLS